MAKVRKEPICLKCKCLVWEGFSAHCVNVLMPSGTIEEAIELAETRIREGEEAAEALEKRQDEEFEKSLANRLMSIPYIVWRRKNVVHYYEGAPKTEEECPFGFSPQ